VYDTFWNVPDKLAKIEQLTDQRDRWQTRAMELEQYIKTRTDLNDPLGSGTGVE